MADPLRAGSRIDARRGLYAGIVRDIGGRIVAGALVPGSILPNEAELMATYAVSRSVVRDAMKVLGEKRLVETRTRIGSRVLPRASWNLLDPDVLAWLAEDTTDAAMVKELLDVRRVVEPAAARLAAERATPTAVAELAEAWEALRTSAEDEAAFIAADLAFHAAVLRASGNQLLVQMLDTIAFGLRATRLVSQRAAETERRLITERIAVHGPIHDAIAAGDAAAAEAAMRTVVDYALGDALRVLAGESGEVPPPETT